MLLTHINEWYWLTLTNATSSYYCMILPLSLCGLETLSLLSVSYLNSDYTFDFCLLLLLLFLVFGLFCFFLLFFLLVFSLVDVLIVCIKCFQLTIFFLLLNYSSYGHKIILFIRRPCHGKTFQMSDCRVLVTT